MPTRDEYVDALEEIRTYIPRIGDQIKETVDGHDEENRPLKAYRCRHGTHVYDVLAVWNDSSHYFTLRYPYDALALFARRQAIEEFDGPVPEGAELEVDLESAETKLDRLAAEYADEYAALFDRLRSTLASPHTSYSIVTTDNGAVGQFYVDRKVFVYADEFGLADLGHGVQMVVSKGFEGRILMEDAYDISESLWAATQDEAVQEADSDSIRYIG